MFSRLSLIAAPFLIIGTLGAAIQQPLISDDPVSDTESALERLERSLKKSPDGLPRIRLMEPVAKPCYSYDSYGINADKNDEQCIKVAKQRENDVFMTDQPGGYYFGNWGSCQRTGDACGIPAAPMPWEKDRADRTIVSNASICHQGNVPKYCIDVQSDDDVVQVFKESKNLSVPIVIKNTGHDWKGRSSAHGALALWTHNLGREPTLERDFSAGSCSVKTTDEFVVRFGAGVQWGGLYKFVNRDDIKLTVMGGTCPTVGVAGWLHGGGHSPLTPSLGMGVDYIRQVKIVTPDGQVRIANKCENPDLFKAVKGGGGGTFGVVTELWYKAVRNFEVQEFTLSLYGLDVRLTREFLEILTSNGNAWAKRGWGGYINTGRQNRSVTIINPRLSLKDAISDMQPLIKFAQKCNSMYVAKSHASWYDYFVPSFGHPDYHKGLWGAAVASRLIPSDTLANETTRETLVDILLDLHYSRVNFIIMPVAPTAFASHLAQDSVLHPTWRTATWLIRINDRWDSFYEAATPSTNHKSFERVHHAMDRIRKLTPDMGVSISESDVWEPMHEESFWGADNYDHLRRTKQIYDPDNVLKVYQGVGSRLWEDRFKCYPRQDVY